MTQNDAAEVARRLTKAQREAVASATFCEQRGAWHPEGWYAGGDRRVRINLCMERLTRDYLRHSNRLTPLGLEVRALLLKEKPNV